MIIIYFFNFLYCQFNPHNPHIYEEYGGEEKKKQFNILIIKEKFKKDDDEESDEYLNHNYNLNF